MLRALLVVNVLLFAGAVIRAPTVDGIWFEYLVFAAFGEPMLLLSLVALCAARRWLHAMGYVGALAALATFEIAITWLFYTATGNLLLDRRPMGFPLHAYSRPPATSRPICSAWRSTRATMVSVGFAAPAVVCTLPSEINRFGTSCARP